MIHNRAFRLLSAMACLLVAGSSASGTRGEELNLEKFKLTFDEEFDSLDVSAAGPGTRWIAHTPYGGDFGDAQFSDPIKDFPFTVKDGILRIEARREANVKWRSGLLSSVDGRGNGFKQQFGYFEIRAKLPAGPGVWPAFWLLGVDRTKRIPEVDVLEFYGHRNDQFHSVIHIWAPDGKSLVGREQITAVAPGSLSQDFHTYGVRVQADTTTFYLDRKAIWTTPSEPEFKEPLYVLLNLALGSGWPIDKTPSPSFMYVDYVKVWSDAL